MRHATDRDAGVVMLGRGGYGTGQEVMMPGSTEDHDRWLEDLRARLERMRRTLEAIGRTRRRQRWEAEDQADPRR